MGFQYIHMRHEYAAESSRTQAIVRLQKANYSQLYQQAVAFQPLHNRHESSLTAIVTFVANVYNRSLVGQVPQNFARMFPNSIPLDQQRQNQENAIVL
jgi:heat shock transcription factor